MNSRDVIHILEADGWLKVAQQGSHVQLKHPVKPGRVTVPHPSREIASGTLRSIEKQSGLPLRRPHQR
ncbi:MAG: type II toxin-antitoxin system HicA family toxin [Methylocella sp.]